MHARLRWVAPLAFAVAIAGCSFPSSSGRGTDSARSSSAPPSASTSQQLRTTPAPWDRPPDQARRVQQAGLSLFATEHLDVHYHAQLKVVVNGEPVPVPGGLGINQGDNGQPPAHGEPGIAPLHTHEADGVLHVESAREDTFTLGQVFIEWGVLLSKDRLGAYHPADDQQHQVSVLVNGEKVHGDPRDIVLKPDQRIAIIVEEGGKSIDMA